MKTVAEGVFQGRPARITVEDGVITEGGGEPFASAVVGWVRAGAHVDIPGMWSGEASLEDPWALRALLLSLLERPRFEGDEPPPLKHGPAGAVY